MSGRSRLLIAACALAALAACEQAKSSNPLSPAIAGPIAGVTISAPQAIAPTADAEIAINNQPITLSVQNATTTGVRPLSYVFDIATDQAFQSIVFTQTGVQPGGSGQTSLQLTQSLPAGQTYYWRAHAQDGANTGAFATSVFTVFTPVVIQPPTPASPTNGATASSAPTLVVTDSSRIGPTGAMSYVFQVASDPNITNIVATGQVPESASQTSYTVSATLAGATTYYWRARGADPTHSSLYSAVASFVTPASSTGTPAPTPSTPIPNQNDTLTNAIVLNSPVGLGNWPITTTITNLNITSSGVEALFSKRDGPGRWPDVVPPGFTGPLEYTLGMCLNITAQWYCSAVIEFWNGLDYSGGPPSQYALNWFYDPVRWAPMTTHQPAVGETIGFFVCAGDCRNNTAGSSSPVKERSNVVLVQMPTDAGASYTFANARRTLIKR